MSPECAAPGCTNPVPRRPGQTGRPPIYCSPACRPSRTRSTLTIEIENHAHDTQPGRDWLVCLRRGNRTVVIAQGLGRFSAAALATELQSLLPARIHHDHPPHHHQGDAID
jgi:hypothetical protein